jgi:hypothetical protein
VIARCRLAVSLPGSLARLRREDTSITPHLIAPRAISRVIARKWAKHEAFCSLARLCRAPAQAW